MTAYVHSERTSQKTNNPHHTHGSRYWSNVYNGHEEHSYEKCETNNKPTQHYLPDGMIVKSTHVCDLEIPGLPYVLEGSIAPNLTVASLVGIRILCKMGCTVVFTDTVCYVSYKGTVILTRYKDPSMDLWVLPITPDAINQEKLQTSQGHDSVPVQLQADPCMARAPQFPLIWTPKPRKVDIAMFTHSVQTQVNAVKFSHQAMCNPKISSLMKAL